MFLFKGENEAAFTKKDEKCRDSLGIVLSTAEDILGGASCIEREC
jgi:hypothetical protein